VTKLKSSPALAVPAARKNEHKRNPYRDTSAGKKGVDRVTKEPTIKALIPDKPTQNVASKENLGKNSTSKPTITAAVGGNESDDDVLDFTPIVRNSFSKPIIATAAVGGDESDDESLDFTPIVRKSLSKPINTAAVGGNESDDDVLEFTPMEQEQPSKKPSVSLLTRKVPRGSTRASSWTTRPPPTSLTALEGTESEPNSTEPIFMDDDKKPATDKGSILETLDQTAPLIPLVDMDAHSKADAPLLDAPAEPPKKHKPLRALSVLGPIPKPDTPKETEETMGDMKSGGGQGPVLTKHKVAGGNFVRLNMRNGAGACRGARNKAKKSKWQLRKEEREQEWAKSRENKRPSNLVGRGNSGPPPPQTGVDPMDDFMDGAFHAPPTKKAGTGAKKTGTDTKKAAGGGATRDAIPKCPGHQKPCKLLKVKKAST
jgi:hypothetical protein